MPDPDRWAAAFFTESAALNFIDCVVEMGHDGPRTWRSGARRRSAARPCVYHGQARLCVSVEFDVTPGR